MKPLQLLFVAGVGLAVMGAAAKLLALLLVLGTLVAFVTRPREVIGLAATIGLLNLFALHPIVMMGLTGMGLAFKALASQSRRADKRGGALRSRD